MYIALGHIDFRDACPRLSGCACPRLSNACPRLSECLPETFECVPETFGCLPETFECLPETFGCLISDLHCSVHSNAHSPTPRTRARSLSRSSRSLRLVGKAVRGIRGVTVAELELLAVLLAILLAVPLFLSLFLRGGADRVDEIRAMDSKEGAQECHARFGQSHLLAGN